MLGSQRSFRCKAETFQMHQLDEASTAALEPASLLKSISRRADATCIQAIPRTSVEIAPSLC